MKYHDFNIPLLDSNQIIVSFNIKIEDVCKALSSEAQYNNPKGLQGQYYILATKDPSKCNKSEGLSYIENQIKKMYNFAREQKEKELLVVPIGPGMQEFYISEIASLFLRNNPPNNIVFPRGYEAFQTSKS